MTARIVGQVLSEDRRPLPRAIVLIESRQEIFVVTTRDDGTFEATVTPGRYWIRAERQGYSSVYFGQLQPNDSAQSIHVQAGDLVRDIAIVLRRPGSIAGHVLDDLGDPVEDATVVAIAADIHMARTNDLGEFRIPRLNPGTYRVLAYPPHPGTRIDQTVFLPTYAPSTTDAGAATAVTVGLSAPTMVDIVLARGRTTEVEGVILSRSGHPLVGAAVHLIVAISGTVGGHQSDAASTVSTEGGRFHFQKVAEGGYRLRASLGPEQGEANVVVGSEPLKGLTIATSAGTTLMGNLVVQGDTRRTCSTPTVVVGRVDTADWGERQGETARVDPGGRFRVDGVYGQTRISVRCPQALPIVQVLVNGRPLAGDVLDATILSATTRVEIVASISGAVRGTVTDEQGRACDCAVLALRDEPDRWIPPYDYMWTARAVNGAFEFLALPAGEYLALVEPIGRRTWDSEYLRLARSRGLRFKTDGHSDTTLTLKCR
jgi:hypothetical protein